MRKIIALLCFILGGYCSYADNIDLMNEKLKKIENNIKEKQKNVKAVKEKESEERGKLNLIKKDLDVTKEKYYKAEATHNNLERKAAYAEKNLSIAEGELKGKNAELKAELRQWNRFGEKDQIEYIFMGETYYEILNRYENMSLIANKSKNDIQNIKKIKARIEVEKANLEQKKSEVLKSKIELENQKRNLDKKAQEKNVLIANLKNKEKYYNEELAKLKAEKAKTEKEIQKIIAERAKKGTTDMTYASIKEKIGDMVYPIGGTVVVKFNEDKTTDFGAKIKSKGIEISGKMGDRIKSAASGNVIFSGSINSLGTVVMVDSGYGIVTVYGNMLKSYATVGKKVERGEIIGILGLSEREREPVLYFEVRKNVVAIDPQIFLR